MKSLHFLKQFVGSLLAFGLLFFAFEQAIAEMPPAGPRVGLRMAVSPEYEMPSTITGQFDKRLLPLWLSALDQPDRDLHRQVADSLVRAKRLGMKGLDESVAAKLRNIFEKADHPVVRRSLARAIIELNDQTAAEMLWGASQKDFLLALIVEPALGTWRYQPAVQAALTKLGNTTTSPRVIQLAMTLLANAKAQNARGPLLQFVQSPSARGDLRLTAATALGEIFSKDLINEAQELSERDRSQDPLGGLLAVRLLSQHQGTESIALLQRLAHDNSTAVQALALQRLGQIDHQLVATFALDSESAQKFSVRHPDANVRMALIESLYSISDLKAIPVLYTFLDDSHPANRTTARDALFHLAQKNGEFRDRVEQPLLDAFATSSWKALEQAAILVGGLDVEACAEPLTRLLSHERPEVAVSSAWALKEIAVPETLPIVLKCLEENLDRKYDVHTTVGRAISERAKQQSQHLNEQLGQMKYADAEPTLRRLIPLDHPNRQINDPLVRATAIWALGLLHQNKPNPQLTSVLMGRLEDIEDMYFPEPEIIGEAAAYAVGWMKDSSGLGMLKRFANRTGNQRGVPHACSWAIEQITGEPLPLGEPVEVPTPSWFLEPLGEPAE